MACNIDEATLRFIRQELGEEVCARMKTSAQARLREIEQVRFKVGVRGPKGKWVPSEEATKRYAEAVREELIGLADTDVIN
jgi:hypothetical protein